MLGRKKMGCRERTYGWMGQETLDWASGKFFLRRHVYWGLKDRKELGEGEVHSRKLEGLVQRAETKDWASSRKKRNWCGWAEFVRARDEVVEEGGGWPYSARGDGAEQVGPEDSGMLLASFKLWCDMVPFIFITVTWLLVVIHWDLPKEESLNILIFKWETVEA